MHGQVNVKCWQVVMNKNRGYEENLSILPLKSLPAAKVGSNDRQWQKIKAMTNTGMYSSS